MSLFDSVPVLFVLGLFAAFWLALGLWALVRGLDMQRRSTFLINQTRLLGSMLESSPHLPIIVRGDQKIEASERVGIWLGLRKAPTHFDELSGEDYGLDQQQHKALHDAISSAAQGGKSFSLILKPLNSSRSLLWYGAPAPTDTGSTGSVLMWLSDVTDNQKITTDLAYERDEAIAAFESLSGLIEASPLPMWYRDNQGNLALVNNAYVEATEAESAAVIVEQGIELVETVVGISASEAARRASNTEKLIERMVPVTIRGERRMMKVVDVPLSDENDISVGVAGYAIDVQELESERAAHRRFVEMQRAMLDRLSAAVAQFSAEHTLIFANQPFRRMFANTQLATSESPDFARLLDSWRDIGKTPEVQDFPRWRQAHVEWFAQPDASEEDWQLRDGTHLRLIAQPTPDGGLLLIVEDQTEQFQLASMRDTMLRVRTATLDNLFEAVAVFAPDGRLHVWNQRFRRLWSHGTEILDEETLTAHPRIDALLARLADRFADSDQLSMVEEIIRAATLNRQQREGWISFADGRYFKFAAIPLPDGNALLIMLDVTDSRGIENALHERNQALETADRVKIAFLSHMSYELRTPLTSIRGFAEMLDGGYAEPLEKTAQSYVKDILLAVAVLQRHIDNVLDLAQAEAGTLKIERLALEIAPLLIAAVADAKPYAAAENVELVSVLPGDPGSAALGSATLGSGALGSGALGEMMGDRARLERLIALLLDNAIRFTGPSRRSGGRVLLHARADADTIELIVSDNGPGLPDIMNDMTKDLSSYAAVGGIGLVLSRQLVAAHKGTIDVVGEKGQGTVVKVVLPRGIER